MNIVFTSDPNIPVYFPVEFLFWGFIIAYVIHILEESVLPEVFVEKVQRNFFPGYSWKKFFGFNTFLLFINILAVIVYDVAGGGWIIFPLCLAVERTLNGFWHLGETIVRRKFSSGLLASVITWILMYMLIRYSLLKGAIPPEEFLTATIIGTMITIAMFATLFVTRAKTMHAIYRTNRAS